MAKSRGARFTSFVAGGLLGLGFLWLISLLNVQTGSAPKSSALSSGGELMELSIEPKLHPVTHPVSDGQSKDQKMSAPAATKKRNQAVLDAVASAWPDDSTRATKIALCESWAGLHPKAQSLTHPDGGVMQINRATWADYFHEEYGWTWEQIVLDLETNLAAAREIYETTGGWQRWACADVVLN